MSSVTFSTTVGGDGSTITDDDNATTGLGNGGALIRLVPMMQQVVNVASHVVSVAGATGDDAAAAAASADDAAQSAIDATNNGAAQVTLAAGQVSLATAQANAAAATYDAFDDRYLGAKTSDPSIDNDGNTLLVGALYWNSSSSAMKVWTGSSWTNPNPAIGYLALAGGTMTGNITFNSTQFGTNVATFLAAPSSANLAAALTDETGTGVNVFNNTPTLIAPLLGTPTSGSLTNCTDAIAYELKSATTNIDVASSPAPSTGQVLTATSPTAATWQPVSSGAITLLSTISASAASTVSFTSVIDSTYNDYVVEVSNLGLSGSSRLCFSISENNGSSYLVGDYFSNENYIYAASLGGQQRTATIGSVTNDTYTLGTIQSNFISFRLCNLNANSGRKQFSTIASLSVGSGSVRDLTNCAYTPTTGSINAVKFFAASGATLTGTFRLYGITKS